VRSAAALLTEVAEGEDAGPTHPGAIQSTLEPPVPLLSVTGPGPLVGLSANRDAPPSTIS
jgi:hypothetical protein